MVNDMRKIAVFVGTKRAWCIACALVLAALAAASSSANAANALDDGVQAGNRVIKVNAPPAAGQKGGPGLALLAKKALAVPFEGEQVVDNAVVLVKDGKIEAIGPARTTPIPPGYEIVDAGNDWLMPGEIDLHSHIGGTFDINDTVYLANPGLRVMTSVVPANDMLKVALASGVTSVLYIPGSGVNCGGQGILIKTGLDHFEDACIRMPGSLKIAQAGNPEGWCIGVGRSFMNWNLRATLRKGVAYAKHLKEARERGEKFDRNFDYDVFPWLVDKKTQVSTHTQIFQVVLTTLTMLRGEFGFDCYIDHGEMAGYRAAGVALELGVQAIIGPREIEVPTRQFIQWSGSNPEAILGIAAEYQKRGVRMIGFNTDAPVVPAEELQLQAGMAGRYGMDFTGLEGVRGLTIIPAKTAHIDDRVGSLEVGKDADILVIAGDPADPRKHVDCVYIDGKRVYDAKQARQRW